MPVPTKVAPKYSTIIPPCGNTNTPTDLGFMFVPSVAKLLLRAQNKDFSTLHTNLNPQPMGV